MMCMLRVCWWCSGFTCLLPTCTEVHLLGVFSIGSFVFAPFCPSDHRLHEFNALLGLSFPQKFTIHRPSTEFSPKVPATDRLLLLEEDPAVQGDVVPIVHLQPGIVRALKVSREHSLSGGRLQKEGGGVKEIKYRNESRREWFERIEGILPGCSQNRV